MSNTHVPNVVPHDSPLISETVPCGLQEFRQPGLPPAAEHSQGLLLQSKGQEATERQYCTWSLSSSALIMKSFETTSDQYLPPKVVLPLMLAGAVWMTKGQMVKCIQEKGFA